jgi:hypothetical protein
MNTDLGLICVQLDMTKTFNVPYDAQLDMTKTFDIPLDYSTNFFICNHQS